MSDSVTCEWCGATFTRRATKGPTPRYCRPAHRQAAHRQRTHQRRHIPPPADECPNVYANGKTIQVLTTAGWLNIHPGPPPTDAPTHIMAQPISEHTDLTWWDLEQLVRQMKADGRIPHWSPQHPPVVS